MAALDRDHIDFSKLEKELHAAVEAEEIYQRENDAKFRAVNQRVATYDEFRDIVLASHIKPLEKGDKIADDRFIQQWNVAAGKNPANKETKPQQSLLPSTKPPKNGHEFNRDWRRCPSQKDKCYFLLRIGAKTLGDIFRSEIGFGLLGDMAAVLNEGPDDRAEDVFYIMSSLAATNRFGLTLQFLNKSEKESIEKLFTNLHRTLPTDELKQNLEELKKKYEMK